MNASAPTIEVSGLPKATLRRLRAQAKNAGVTVEIYAKQLIEEGISLEQIARTRSFDELYAPVQERFRKSGMKEEELDKLVDRARTRHHRRSSRKKD